MGIIKIRLNFLIFQKGGTIAEFIEERSLENTEYVNYKTYAELNAFRNANPTWGVRDGLMYKDGSSGEEADYLSYYVWDEGKSVTYFFVIRKGSTMHMSFEQTMKDIR